MKCNRQDKFDQHLNDGDIIDIHQTVNGCRYFLIKSVEPLDIRYLHDFDRKYEYDKEEFLARCRFTGESVFEIIGHITTFLTIK